MPGPTGLNTFKHKNNNVVNNFLYLLMKCYNFFIGISHLFSSNLASLSAEFL